MKASSSRIPIVVMASGGGSGFVSIVEEIESGRLNAEIRALVCDRPDAPVLVKAKQSGIRTILIPFEKEKGREAHDEGILGEILPLSPRFLVMAGYMRIITPRLIEAFRSERGYSRIVNIHPSLLPSFPGMSAYAQAYRYGVKVAGATVHFVESVVDSGPICAQEAFSIAHCASEAEVESSGKELEHRLYPRTLSWVLPEKFEIVKFDVQAAVSAGSAHHPGYQRRLCVRPN